MKALLGGCTFVEFLRSLVAFSCTEPFAEKCEPASRGFYGFAGDYVYGSIARDDYAKL